MGYKSYEEINEKINTGKAVIVTAEEMKSITEEIGVSKASRKVDVVTTGTFAPMCSSGVFLNFGHSDPPIRMTRIKLNDVPAYGGIAAVDAYIGATELSESAGMEYGGAHVIEDLIAGKDIRLYAESNGTDCYPRKHIDTFININNINQAIMFNPRNAYQNYPAAINTSDRILYTYLGTLLPLCSNINYTTSGELSPLLNDPMLRTIGIGTRIFLGGTTGFVSFEGTQHNPMQARSENGIPVGGASTLSLTGNLKLMKTRYVRAAIYEKYGISLIIGIGIPIPVLDEDIAYRTSVRNKDIYTNVLDYGVQQRNRPVIKRVSYAELRSGIVDIEGKKVPTAPLSSLKMAREIAAVLKNMIIYDKFRIAEPIEQLSDNNAVQKLEIRESKNEMHVPAENQEVFL